MSEPYRRNHTFPRVLLDRYWATSHPARGYRGVHVHDIRTGKRSFSSAAGKRAFSFAIEDDIYVPEVAGRRATGAERWLGGLDGKLAGLARELSAANTPFVAGDDLLLLLMSLHMLNVRSPYVVRRIADALRELPELRSRISAHPERDVERLAVENLAHSVNEMAARDLLTTKWVLHPEEGAEFLLADRPVADFGSHRVAVLAPRLAVAIAPVETEADLAGWKHFVPKAAPAALVATINRHLALEARCWLAARDETVLEAHLPILRSPEWAERRASERWTVERPRWLRNGLSLRD